MTHSGRGRANAGSQARPSRRAITRGLASDAAPRLQAPTEPPRGRLQAFAPPAGAPRHRHSRRARRWRSYDGRGQSRASRARCVREAAGPQCQRRDRSRRAGLRRRPVKIAPDLPYILHRRVSVCLSASREELLRPLRQGVVGGATAEISDRSGSRAAISARHAATLAVGGIERFTAMAAKIRNGSIAVGSTPASANARRTSSALEGRPGRRRGFSSVVAI